jgi:hypothetical protein
VLIIFTRAMDGAHRPTHGCGRPAGHVKLARQWLVCGKPTLL